MSKGPFVIFGVFAAICVIVIPYFALAKEGGEDAGPVKVESWDEDGKELFVNNCGALPHARGGRHRRRRRDRASTTSWRRAATRPSRAATCGR